MRAVGASPVVMSPLANVFVSLSYVMVFRIVKLVIPQTIVTLVFCGMLEYFHVLAITPSGRKLVLWENVVRGFPPLCRFSRQSDS